VAIKLRARPMITAIIAVIIIAIALESRAPSRRSRQIHQAHGASGRLVLGVGCCGRHFMGADSEPTTASGPRARSRPLGA
jgi:NO-binding membrane sensor protein with MHYT domain